MPAHDRFRVHTYGDHRTFALRLDAIALEYMCSALHHKPVSAPTIFENRNDERRDYFLQGVKQFVRDLDLVGTASSPQMYQELERALLVKFIISYSQSFDEYVEEHQPVRFSKRLRLMEEYIHANYARPLEIVDIAAEFGTSGRTIFRLFSQAFNQTPLEYVKVVRLEKARERLLRAPDDMGVTHIALQCGFQSLGHFAREYRLRFGELPSETLARGRARLR